jgi:hypothetical protein
MENCINYDLINFEDDWSLWNHNQQHALAWMTLTEWLCSKNFKAKATYFEIAEETTIGQRFIAHTREDQWWKDKEYKALRSILDGVYSHWKTENWVWEETTKNGRPRRAEYSPKQLSSAMRYINLPFVIEEEEQDVLFKGINRARSICGEATTESWVRLVVVKPSLFREIYRIATVSEFTGFTREEIAENLNLPKAFVNEMCRWLVNDLGWEIVRRRCDNRVRRELRLTAYKGV